MSMNQLYIIATDPNQDLNARYEAVRMMKQMKMETKNISGGMANV